MASLRAKPTAEVAWAVRRLCRMAGPPEIDIGSIADVVNDQARFAADVLAHVDGLDAAIRGLREPMVFTVEHAVGRPDPPHWVGAVVNQLNNDVTDLVQDAICGRGRPAIRTARSLFDHLLTVRDVTSAATLAERYECHRWVVWHDATELAERTHRGNLTRSEAHRRRLNRREIGPEARAALAAYGRGFRREWATADRRARAGTGLADDYEWYRLASAILHGSAGGVLGTYAEFRNGPHIHRTGSAFTLCPDALEWGLRWARLAYDALAPEVGAITRAMTDAIAEVEALTPEFRRLIEEHDRTLWTTNPTHLEAFVLVTRWPTPRQWYLRIVGSDWVRRAIEPSELIGDTAWLDKVIADARRDFPADTDCISIVVNLGHRRIYPDPDSGWPYSPQMFQHAGLNLRDPTRRAGFETVVREDLA